MKIISFLNAKNLKKCKNQIYIYAANYEDFVKLIKTSNSLDELKELDYRIIIEVIHSTMISNLKRSKLSNSFSNDTNKGELLMSRDLEKYINQLKYAKKLCERRIKGFNNVISDNDNVLSEKRNFVEREVCFLNKNNVYENLILNKFKVVPFEKIMNCVESRNSFMKFLEIDGSDALLR
jgi:hypothetical protein